jgi:predicted ATPase
VSIAEEISHPFSLGYARCFAGAIYSGRYEPHVTLQYAEQAIALAQAQGFPHFQVMGTLLYGWALAVLGKQEEGTKHLQQALDAQKRIGFEVGRSFYLTLLSEVYCNAGLTEQGLQIVAEGLDRVQHKGEWFYAAELYRIKGELILQSGAGDWRLAEKKRRRFNAQSSTSQNPSTHHLTLSTQVEAEQCFLRAIEIAQHQTTKLFELRATIPLCHLRERQGKVAQARQTLDKLYRWFTEGLDTPDLQKARILREALS